MRVHSLLTRKPYRDQSQVVDPMAPRKIRGREIRVPTWDEYLNFDGAHCRILYAGLQSDWVCPGCARSRYQILRWTIRFPKRPDRHEGWAAGLHRHHDHSIHKPRGPFGFVGPRFGSIVICEQCNSADGTAKRVLKLPEHFSFAPWEIGQFVRATAHGFHDVNYDLALQIFRQLQAANSL